MRIALLTYSTKPRGGVVHTLALAEALAAVGEEVTVWTLGRDSDQGFFRPVDAAVHTRIIDLPPVEGEPVGPRILRSIATLQAAFNPADYDVVHAQDCITANAAGPCIRTIHHLDNFTTPELAACHERAVVEPVARVCVSAAVAAEVKAGWGLDARVIPNGVDAERFLTAGGRDAWAASARWSWQCRLGRYLLAVGGIEPRKATIDLLEAFALVGDRHPGLSLVLAGGETLFDYRDYRERFDARAAELGVPCQVLGTVAHQDMPALIAGAEALCCVSVKEGFGLAPMEALAAGVPVVVRDLPVFHEVFGPTVGYGADVASIASAIDLALARPRDRERRRQGRELASSYTWEAAAGAHLEMYHALLGQDATIPVSASAHGK